MIQYTIVKKKVLTGSHPGEIKYYPKIVRAKTIDTDEIAELLQQRTTLSDSEVRAFLNGLSQAISYYVCALILSRWRAWDASRLLSRRKRWIAPRLLQ